MQVQPLEGAVYRKLRRQPGDAEVGLRAEAAYSTLTRNSPLAGAVAPAADRWRTSRI